MAIRSVCKYLSSMFKLCQVGSSVTIQEMTSSLECRSIKAAGARRLLNTHTVRLGEVGPGGRPAMSEGGITKNSESNWMYWVPYAIAFIPVAIFAKNGLETYGGMLHMFDGRLPSKKAPTKK